MREEINWKEIKHRAIISFATVFIFNVILVTVFINIFTQSQGEIGYLLAIYIYIALFLNFPVGFTNFLIELKLNIFIKLILVWLIIIILGLFIGLVNIENAKFRGGPPFIAETLYTLTAMTPLIHLTRYKNAKFSKYIWGGVSGVLGVILSALIFLVIMFASFFIMLIPFAFLIVPPVVGGGTAAFYWFFISLAEEIYRIKYELKQ